MNIAVAQINSTVGDIGNNTQKILEYCRKAEAKGADIVVFPELSLCGYPPEDLVFKPDFVRKNKYFLRKLKEGIGNILVIVGFVDSKDSHYYNAAALIYRKKILHIYHKIILPNYGVFDEKRYFTPGGILPVYKIRENSFSLNICEDIWRGKEMLKEAYRSCPFNFIINISASPFNLGKIKERQKILEQRAKQFSAAVIYCNLVGGQDELVFDGGSMVIDTRGRLVRVGKRFREDLFYFNPSVLYGSSSLILNKVQDAYEALILGIKDYVKKNNFQRVVVGVSGGIDSALVLTLAKYALGSRKVEALIMPSRYTSKGTLRDAQRLCTNLKVKYYLIDIENIVESVRRSAVIFASSQLSSLTSQNIQARVRGLLLMAFSNQKGALVLNTGNKSELSVGYCTLYGDMVGGFGVLKDIYKTMVYKLACYVNRRYNHPIPSAIISRPPSAELKAGQKDEDDLPPYKVLDEVLKLYIEKEMPFDKIVNYGFSRSVVKQIIQLVDRNEYKRRQSPPGVKVTTRAFGKERRMPIVNKFRYS